MKEVKALKKDSEVGEKWRSRGVGHGDKEK
jgi:hypothetical protein